MTKLELADKLATAVNAFTSFDTFKSASERSKEDHTAYRAQLYRDMCEALKEYQQFKETLDHLTA